MVAPGGAKGKASLRDLQVGKWHSVKNSGHQKGTETGAARRRKKETEKQIRPPEPPPLAPREAAPGAWDRKERVFSPSPPGLPRLWKATTQPKAGVASVGPGTPTPCHPARVFWASLASVRSDNDDGGFSRKETN